MRHTRETVEGDIGSASRCLALCVEMIRDRHPIADWPEDARMALLSACFGAPDGDIERRKAAALRWHLFRRSAFEAFRDVPADGHAAERLRADLPGLVGLGSGRFLLGDIERLTLPAMAPRPNSPGSGTAP